MIRIIKDKIIEKNRFDERAINLLKSGNKIGTFGSASIPLVLRLQYMFYEEKIKELIKSAFKFVLVAKA